MITSYEGVIRWEDPPPAKVGGTSCRRAWATVAGQLRDRPNRWGLIAQGSPSWLVPRIHAGKSWWSPAGSFEATARIIDEQLCVWARYVGAPDHSSAPEDSRGS